MSNLDVMSAWTCPFCGRELKIGPAFMNFWPYCPDPDCRFNHHIWTTEATTCKNEKEK